MRKSRIAEAYVQFVPSFSGFGPALSKELNGQSVKGALNKVGSSQGRNFGSRLGSAASAAFSKAFNVARFGAGLIGGVAAALGGLALGGGLNRALGLEQASATLKGLGYEMKNIASIRNDVLAAVEGTIFSLNDAMSIGASALAAGVSQGKDLTRYLSLIADTATIIPQRTISEIGLIFNSIQGMGRAYTEDLRQLAEAGLPIFSWLATEMGVTQEAARKLASEGKISSQIFLNAIQQNIGGAATKGADTAKGAFLNMVTAINRAVANQLTNGLELFRTLFLRLREVIDRVGKALEPFSEKFWTKFADAAQPAIGKVLSLVERFADTGFDLNTIKIGRQILGIRDYVSKLYTAIKPSLSAIADLLGFNIDTNSIKDLGLQIATFVNKVIVQTVELIKNISRAFADFSLVNLLKDAVTLVDALYDGLMSIINPLVKNQELIKSIVGLFIAWRTVNLGISAGKGIMGISTFLSKIVKGAKDAKTSVFGFLETLNTGRGAIGALFKDSGSGGSFISTWSDRFKSVGSAVTGLASKVGTQGKRIRDFFSNLSTARIAQQFSGTSLSAITGFGQAIETAASPNKVGLLQKVGEGFKNLAGNIKTAAIAAGTFAVTMAKNVVSGVIFAATAVARLTVALWRQVTAWVASTAAAIADRAAKIAQAIATGIATAAQWLLNIAMYANPIGIIIAAVAALIAVIALLATQTTFFQDLWKGFLGFVNDSLNILGTGLQSIGRGADTLFRSMRNGIIGFMNVAIAGVNTILSAIESLRIPIPPPLQSTFGPYIGIQTKKIPYIPMLAQGGDIWGPTLAWLGEGGRPETVTDYGRTNELISEALRMSRTLGAQPVSADYERAGDTIIGDIHVHGDVTKQNITKLTREIFKEAERQKRNR